MGDLISRSAVEEICTNYQTLLKLRELPAIDAVPVVYCKDCKHMKERHYEGPGEPPYIKRTCGSKYGLSKPYTVEEWDFCSRGERKEDTNDH